MGERIWPLLSEAWADFRSEDLYNDWDDDRRKDVPEGLGDLSEPVPDPHEGGLFLPAAMADYEQGRGFGLYYAWRQSQDSLAEQLGYNAVGWARAAAGALAGVLGTEEAYVVYRKWTAIHDGTPVELDELGG
jgi:hypothetical protein